VIDISWTTVAHNIVAPEGPASDQQNNVYLVSRWTGRVLKVDANGQVSDVVHTGGKPQSVAFLQSGDLLLADAENHALQRITPEGVLTTVADTVEGQHFLGPNDLVVGAGSVVYMTDPGLNFAEPGRILRIEIGSGRTSILSNGHHFPNGITITANGRYLMVTESVTHRVLRFELLEGGRRLGQVEVFYQFPDHHPDGLAFDAKGNLLVTLCGSGHLAVVSPQRRIIASIPTGGSNCTNCVFGGDNFQTLYLTEDCQEAILSTNWPVPGQKPFSRSLT